jgi:hypothetical protein
MQTEEYFIDKCKEQIEQKTGWGKSTDWTHQDFTELSEKIYEHTRVSLSPTTLKRLWGKVKYESLPTVNTLNTLAHFAGYENWREFKLKNVNGNGHTSVHSVPIQPFIDSPTVTQPPAAPPRLRKRSMGVLALLPILFLGGWAAIRTFSESNKPSLVPNAFSFRSKPLAKGIPNSVVFTYDATAAPNDSVYIQQSWDERRRVKVSKDQHQHTSVYYQPGYFRAKLVVNNQIVKEHDLFIPSEGWVASVDQNPVPVYFPEKEVRNNGVLGVPVSLLEASHIPMQPQAPIVTFRNVQDFKGLRSDNFTFETEIRNDYKQGSAVCQFAQIMLLLENDMMLFPFSNLGCVGELYASVADKSANSKTSNLSGFGSDMSHWTKFQCEARDKKVQLFVNGKKAFETTFTNPAARIVGIHYGFQGTGSVNYTRLSRANGEVVFEDNF